MATTPNPPQTIKKSTIEAGDIKFIDNIEPPLKAGQYTLSAEQTIGGVTNDGKPLPKYESSQQFLIKGTQFSIKPSIIHAKYPAELAVGSYGNSLPHIVLTDFALPWSRPIDPADQEANPDTPWIGLLTIHPSEWKTLVSEPQYVTVQQLITPTGDIQGPLLNIKKQGLNPTTQVSVVDIDFPTFQNISPTLEDLKYLAHGREVNTGGKVMLGMDADGLFSLLVGNRLPGAGAADSEPEDNHILLVSYEGHSTHIRGGAAPTKSKVRLVVLHAWKFTEEPVLSSFLGDMTSLCDPGSGGVTLLQMPGNLPAIDDTTKENTAKKALEIGYTALQNDMRAGEVTTSWYRGPLVPTPTKRQADFHYGTFLYGEHAIHYDPATGIFDHSYAAAWQVGRLLGLSDGPFARTLFAWRNAYVLVAIQAAEQQKTNAKKAIIAGRDANDDLATASLSNSVTFSLGRGLSNIEWPNVQSRSAKMLGDHLPGVLSEEDKDRIADQDEDPLMLLLKD